MNKRVDFILLVNFAKSPWTNQIKFVAETGYVPRSNFNPSLIKERIDMFKIVMDDFVTVSICEYGRMRMIFGLESYKGPNFVQ